MNCKLHYVEFRPGSSKTGSHLRKGKITAAKYRPFEVETIELIAAGAQNLWNSIVAEGKEVDFRRIEIYNWDWQPA